MNECIIDFTMNYDVYYFKYFIHKLYLNEQFNIFSYIMTNYPFNMMEI